MEEEVSAVEALAMSCFIAGRASRRCVPRSKATAPKGVFMGGRARTRAGDERTLWDRDEGTPPLGSFLPRPLVLGYVYVDACSGPPKIWYGSRSENGHQGYSTIDGIGFSILHSVLSAPPPFDPFLLHRALFRES